MRGGRNRPCVVYLITNMVNGHKYVGITTRSPAIVRFKEHMRNARKPNHNGIFPRAIRKYGKAAFRMEVIEKCDSVDDALAAEKRHIDKLLPEYNSTAGGDGNVRHADETREKLREVAMAKKEEWLKHRHLGPAASAKRVVCLDDGSIYESASAAAKCLGVPKSLIIQVCNKNKNRRTAAGKVFRYFGDHHGGAEEARAQKALRIETHRNAVVAACGKPVICITDGKTYASAAEAANAYGIDKVFLCEVCRGKKRSAKKRIFRYMDEALRVRTT